MINNIAVPFSIIFLLNVIPLSQLAQPRLKFKGESPANSDDFREDEVRIFYSIKDSILVIGVCDKSGSTFSSYPLSEDFWILYREYQRKIRSAETEDMYFYGNRLYEILLSPVANFLVGKNKLIVVPDQNILDLPFETLVTRKESEHGGKAKVPRFLIEDIEIVYRAPESSREIPKILAMGKTHDSSVHQTYSLIGITPGVDPQNPDYLPEASKELDSIGVIFRNRGMPFIIHSGITGLVENRSAVCGKGKIVHLASHYLPGQILKSNTGFLPEDSGLHCAQRFNPFRYINPVTICDLNLEADLIVLNACKSGLVMSNSGILTNLLPQLLIKAGASNIISTLWNVNDHLARLFMLEFYRKLLNGESYSSALRSVKLGMIGHRETSLPNVWAPYILTEGD